ncbi:MAG TPA: hypothetical protein VND99_03335 [Candidatus Acidoferrales bacterium]|nr:hypothetical protein [Candidatus Acidoferrales bacterium]
MVESQDGTKGQGAELPGVSAAVKRALNGQSPRSGLESGINDTAGSLSEKMQPPAGFTDRGLFLRGAYQGPDVFTWRASVARFLALTGGTIISREPGHRQFGRTTGESGAATSQSIERTAAPVVRRSGRPNQG